MTSRLTARLAGPGFQSTVIDGNCFTLLREAMGSRFTWHIMVTHGALLIAWVLGSCASAPVTTEITKVKYYHLNDTDRESLSIDPMIRFEREHLLHGAVTEADQQQRLGHYYALFWSSATPMAGPVTVRFDYRQIGTGERVFRLEQVIPNARKRNTTLLRVSGEPYQQHGRVVAWRASIWRDGKEIDVMRSFLWK